VRTIKNLSFLVVLAAVWPSAQGAVILQDSRTPRARPVARHTDALAAGVFGYEIDVNTH
jgi:hypothetical protein